MLLWRRSEAHFPHKLQHGGTVSLHTFFFWKESTWFVIFTNQSTPPHFFQWKKTRNGLNSHKNPDLFDPPTSTRPLPLPPFFLGDHMDTLGWEIPRGWRVMVDPLAPHNSPSQFGNPTTPRVHGNSIKTFRKSCCCWNTELECLETFWIVSAVHIFEVPDQYSTIFEVVPEWDPKVSKIHPHELELGIHLDIVNLVWQNFSVKNHCKTNPLNAKNPTWYLSNLLHLHLCH